MVDELKKHGIVLHLHICGDTTKITEDFIATGTQVLEIDHKTDAERLKEATRGRTCLLGNIDTNLLALGKPEEVDAACRELIESCQAGGGLILGAGCALPPRGAPDGSPAAGGRPRRQRCRPGGRGGSRPTRIALRRSR